MSLSFSFIKNSLLSAEYCKQSVGQLRLQNKYISILKLDHCCIIFIKNAFFFVRNEAVTLTKGKNLIHFDIIFVESGFGQSGVDNPNKKKYSEEQDKIMFVII